MYAQRFQPSHASRPFSAGAALLINGAIFAALIYAVPSFNRVIHDKDPPLIDIRETPPPDPEPLPKPKDPDIKLRETKIVVPETKVPPISENHIGTTNDIPDTPPLGPVVGTEPTGGDIVKPLEPPPPPLLAPKFDSRYAEAMQPPYPAGELRVGKEGVAKVRVLVGTDGRVKDVQKISADSDAFFDATRRQALSKWRFKPATRGGTAEEAWYTATVRFTIDNQ